MRQHLQLGVSYTRLTTNAETHGELYAVSVYPQLTFFPRATSRIAESFPHWARPYFFVRALGPSFLSENKLGEREQDHHFSFQAQLGAGVLLRAGAEQEVNLNISWKHFSNANLFSDNDGLDVPFVLTVGVRF